MHEPRNYRLSLIVAATMAATVMGSGCAARVRLYDADHRDYHQWDDHEDRAYHRYMTERHQDYRPISQLNSNDQRDYWTWRHSHHDAGN